MDWGSSWSSLGNVIAQANAFKENLEKQLDEAVGVSEDDNSNDNSADYNSNNKDTSEVIDNAGVDGRDGDAKDSSANGDHEESGAGKDEIAAGGVEDDRSVVKNENGDSNESAVKLKSNPENNSQDESLDKERAEEGTQLSHENNENLREAGQDTEPSTAATTAAANEDAGSGWDEEDDLELDIDQEGEDGVTNAAESSETTAFHHDEQHQDQDDGDNSGDSEDQDNILVSGVKDHGEHQAGDSAQGENIQKEDELPRTASQDGWGDADDDSIDLDDIDEVQNSPQEVATVEELGQREEETEVQDHDPSLMEDEEQEQGQEQDETAARMHIEEEAAEESEEAAKDSPKTPEDDTAVEDQESGLPQEESPIEVEGDGWDDQEDEIHTGLTDDEDAQNQSEQTQQKEDSDANSGDNNSVAEEESVEHTEDEAKNLSGDCQELNNHDVEKNGAIVEGEETTLEVESGLTHQVNHEHHYTDNSATTEDAFAEKEALPGSEEMEDASQSNLEVEEGNEGDGEENEEDEPQSTNGEIENDSSAHIKPAPTEGANVQSEILEAPILSSGPDEAHRAEIERLQHVLEARERQLESTLEQSSSLMSENTHLQEELSKLKAQLSETEEASRRYQMQAEGKQSSQKSLQDALRKAEQRARSADERMKEAVSKHEALMAEGMALSKRMGTVEQNLKKMREEKRAAEAESQALKTKLAQSEETCTSLREELRAAEDRHKKELSSWSDKASSSADVARKFSEAQTKIEEQASRIQHLTASLDEAWKEVSEHKRETSAVKQDLNTARVEQEKLRHQLKEQISSTQVRNDVASVMERNVADMQKAMEEQGSQQSLTEEHLRSEIKSLKHQLQLAEKRNEDLVSNSAKATRPLLRQIEALESSNQTQRNSYESAHSSIMARLLASEQAESAARAARQQAEAARSDMQLRLAELQASLDGAASEKSRMEAQLRSVKDRLNSAERENEALLAQLESVRDQHSKRIDEIKAGETKLRRAMAMAEERHEQEVADLTRLHEEARDRLERKIVDFESHARTSHLLHRSASSRTASDFHLGDDATSIAGSALSMPGGGGPRTQESILADLNLGGDLNTESSSQAPAPPMEEYPMHGTPSLVHVQQLRAQVHQKEGQIEGLKEQISSIERARDALSEELVRVSERARKASALAKEVATLRKELEEKTDQHEVLLEMFGETQEELDELRSEQETIRQSFRRQLEALVAAQQHQ